MSSFTHTLSQIPESRRIGRPSFTSQKTSDRLREGERASSNHSMRTSSAPRRSVFREEGLHDLSTSVHIPQEGDTSLASIVDGAKDTKSKQPTKTEPKQESGDRSQHWYSRLGKGSRPLIKDSSAGPPATLNTMSRLALIIILIAVILPGFRYSGGKDKVAIIGADAGVIRVAELVDNASAIEGRQNSPTDVCTRWAQQVANVNGTVYIYGGEATQTSGQDTNTWNNNLLTLDLTRTWKIASPSISGLPQPSGPPAVALGSLWNSWDKLWLYGGEFADNPSTSPLAVSTWEYDIKSAAWTEQANPQTSAGNNSDGGNTPVQRAAEGAGLSVPELGRSWYFGGHLDMYTTAGWSNQIARVYLRSLLEFTHPGFANTGVTSLGSSSAAGSTGVYRNITQGGLQADAGFTERADGVLVYVPGWGDNGIILGLAGGTNISFTEMNVIDIYDIASSQWYKQATSGPSPPIRVNPCAAVAAASDGSSFNIYLYGGQNLIPYDSQIQYSDMWILTIPSFTWIQVDMTGQSEPPARAGHSCVMWDSQLVVIGGYVGKNISCDSPGIYVFNASSLQWTTSFTALSSDSSSKDTNGQVSSVLQGSVGYEVPAVVQSVIGGSSLGGATATQPAAGSATTGPIATGKPPTFTVTASGTTVIQTAVPTSTGASGVSEAKNGGNNTGAIVAGVIAGMFAFLAVYLGWCAWLYRRQLGLYKDHVAMAQRAAFAKGGSQERDAWDMSEINSKVGTGIMVPGFGSEPRTSGSVGESSGEAAKNENVSGSGNGEGTSGGVMTGANPADGRDSWERPSTARSSMDDLLGGQEPSFFSVILNPRRTLRVVNSD